MEETTPCTSPKGPSTSYARKKPCPRCGKLFIRLDTHLKNSATCKNNPQATVQTAEPSLPIQLPDQDTTSSTAMRSALRLLLSCRPFKTPKTDDQWREDDHQLAETVIPEVKDAQNVDEKSRILCEGIYNHFASKYGMIDKSKRASQPRRRSHNRPLKRLRRERNEARKDLRRARSENQDGLMIQELAKKFHNLIRKHSKARKESLKTRVNLEAGKARRECGKSFWHFAAKLLDDEGTDGVTPAFGPQTAETFFHNVYSSNTRTFECPEWLPEPPTPTESFDEEPITAAEVLQVIKKSRNSSSPSPINQDSYRVLKRCPSLLPTLTDLYNSCWESATIPPTWKQGVV